jgi:uncharacterized delta-60 repeat protein
VRTRRGVALVAAKPGALDQSFGDHGRALAVFGAGQADASAVAVDRKGEVATAGLVFTPNEDFAVALFQPSGVPDGHFSGDGEEQVDLGGPDDEAHGVAFDNQGRVLVAGSDSSGTTNDFAVLRFKRNGDPDPSFGDAGRKIFSLSTGNDNITA